MANEVQERFERTMDEFRAGGVTKVGNGAGEGVG